MTAQQARLLSDPTTQSQYRNVMDAIEDAVKNESFCVLAPLNLHHAVSAALQADGYIVSFAMPSNYEISW